MNRNYNTPSVPEEWANSRQTDMPIAVATHAISDDTRPPEEIWEAPSPEEWDHTCMAVDEYVRNGDFPYDPSGYAWGVATITVSAPDRKEKP